MTNEKRYISNCTSPIDTERDRVVVRVMELPLKKQNQP